jgi:pyruvate/2-oxoacid:ferredoxin oxidoreductase alpha subunit
VEETQILTGNQAAALGARLCRVQVVAAYPITPQSKIPEVLSEYVERGELKAEFVRVESEHSAMGVCISASIVGARVFTATAANGLAYMHEQLHWAAGARLPIVMPVTNRGVGAPWTILNDMQDSISQRDTGWMQFYCMNNQEILDQIIIAYKVAEQLLIPVMVCFDGFRLSHTMMPVTIPSQNEVDRFLPDFDPPYDIVAERPVNINPVVMSDALQDGEGVLCPSYMGFRRRLQESFEDALPVIAETGKHFGDVFGRSYEDLLYRYRVEDADFLFLTMGSLCSEASETADMLREEGIRAGVLGLRVYRPFPAVALARAMNGAQSVAVVEKAISYGYEGALATELKASLFSSLSSPRTQRNSPEHEEASLDQNGRLPAITNFIVGLGGKDVRPQDLLEAAHETIDIVKAGGRQEKPRWLGSGL